MFPMDFIFHSTTDVPFLLLSHIIIVIYFIYCLHIFQRFIYYIHKRASQVCHCDRRWVGLIFVKKKNAIFCSTYVYTPKIGRTIHIRPDLREGRTEALASKVLVEGRQITK